ncbi:MAG: hypothetical protein LC776_19240, partial [Acidobacteria bacterium]|nr:hypothetical protein [Acidobacteriota bacterium]
RSAGRGGHQLSKTHAARTRGTAAFDTKLPATGVSKLLTHSGRATAFECIEVGRFVVGRAVRSVKAWRYLASVAGLTGKRSRKSYFYRA